MDCLCCAAGGAGPTTDTEFLGSVCNLMTQDGITPAKFPLEANRYILYVVAGCPFAARPWAPQAIYGLPIRVVKLFPASYEDGWFFQPASEGEQELVSNFPTAATDADPLGHGHLKEIYAKAHPDFKGAISVPLLCTIVDTKQNTAVGNSSFGLSEMLETQLKPLATRNMDIELYQNAKEHPLLAKEHADLLEWLHASVTTAVHKMNATKDGKLHDELVDSYYQSLNEMQDRLLEHDKKTQSKQSVLMGTKVRFADIVLCISLIRLDLAYQWRFGLRRYNIRDD